MLGYGSGGNYEINAVESIVLGVGFIVCGLNGIGSEMHGAEKQKQEWIIKIAGQVMEGE